MRDFDDNFDRASGKYLLGKIMAKMFDHSWLLIILYLLFITAQVKCLDLAEKYRLLDCRDDMAFLIRKSSWFSIILALFKWVC